jgi:glycosyltransferase involved in cell wall biosynthesis
LSLYQQYRNAPLFFWFRRIIKQQHIDLVHFYSLTAPTWAAMAARSLGVPTIYTPMSIYACGLVQIRLDYHHHPGWATIIDGCITHYIALSEYIRSEYTDWRGINERKVSLNWLGVDLERFTLFKRKDLRTKFDLPEDAFLALTVARLDPLKRIHILIEAIALARQEGCSVTLAIAGPGPLLSELQGLSTRLGVREHVAFLGSLDNDLIPDLYKCVDVYVVAGGNPNLGLAVLEAMASGLPLVIYTEGNLEQQRMGQDTCVHGENGYIANGVSDMAKRLCELESNAKLRLSMSATSRTLAESRFDLKKHMRNVEQLYAQLLADGDD